MLTRDTNGEINYRTFTSEITMMALDSKEGERKIGILLCEGDENSIDMAIYSALFPCLLVIPVGGCTTVVRFVPRLRNSLSLLGMYVFGIIDRDALSKKEIRRLFETHGVNTTKLPFIENIICSPEALKVVCEYRKLNYSEVLAKVEGELLKTLWQKLKEALPINIGVEKNERILELNIGVATRKKQIVKIVDKDSILYSYRDKVIISIVSSAVGLRGRKAYYDEIFLMLEDPVFRPKLIKVFSTFVPKLEAYDIENE